MWENVIRQTLNKAQPDTKFKCYCKPTSPSRFKPSDDALDIEDVVVLEIDSEGVEEVYPFNDESNFDDLMEGPKALNCNLTTLANPEENVKPSPPVNSKILTRILSKTERMGLSWPKPPLDLLAQCISERPNLLKTVKSFKTSKSFRTYASFKSYIKVDNRITPEEVFLGDLDSTMYRKRRPPYVRIVSKQMVGIFITVWVRRRLRKHIQNVHVLAVGVGVMGYIGNKGTISETDAVKRNTDVHEIHKRTRFNILSNSKRIENHKRLRKHIQNVHVSAIGVGVMGYISNKIWIIESSCVSDRWWTKVPEIIPRALSWRRKAEFNQYEYFVELFCKAPIELAPTKDEVQCHWYAPSNYYFMWYVPRSPPVSIGGLYVEYLNKRSATRAAKKKSNEDPHPSECVREASLIDHVRDLESICETLLTLPKESTSEDEPDIKDYTSPKEDDGNVYCCDDNEDVPLFFMLAKPVSQQTEPFDLSVLNGFCNNLS
nr:type IV inositol polyphosphate 5-phosphatase 3 isoform X2 [Tanacetum cinerariifolium]